MYIPPEKIHNFIVNNNIATDEEVSLVSNINGYSQETMNDIIHVRTEYHDIDQLHDCEPENYDFSSVIEYLEEDNEDDQEYDDSGY